MKVSGDQNSNSFTLPIFAWPVLPNRVKPTCLA